MLYYMRLAGQYVLALWAALTVNFMLPRLAPGDPLNSVLGSDVVETMTDEKLSELRLQLGLDGTMFEQYLRYLKGIFTLDLGNSSVLGMPVWDALMQRLPWTYLLMGCALLLSTLIGTSLGVISAWKRGQASDVITTSVVMFLGALPGFWLAMMLIILFSTTLGWLPSFGAYQLGTHFPDARWFVGVGKRLILPVTALCIVLTSSTLLTARSSMQMAQDQDYILFARARGVGERGIFFRHALRNALLPVYTHMMLGLGGLIGGTLVVETVFSYPGIGSLIVMGVNARDYLLLQGIFVLTSLSILLANLLTDLLYPLIDPRTRRA